MINFPEGRALVIGVGNHKDVHWDVPPVLEDAHQFAATLVDPTAGGYNPRNVELLLGPLATRARVLAALRRLSIRATPESVVIIALACQGVVGTDGLYTLATSDANFTPAGNIVADTGLDAAALARVLQELPARRVLIVLNTGFAEHHSDCQSALPVQVGAALPDEVGNLWVGSGEGRVIITASRPTQHSLYLRSQRHSLFGQALVEVLRSVAGRSPAGIFEVYEGIYNHVIEVARSLGAVQEPTLTLLQGTVPFPLAASLSTPSSSGPVSQVPPKGAVVRQEPAMTIAGPPVDRAVLRFEGEDISVDNVSSDYLAAKEPEVEPEPWARLHILRARVEVARNVDEVDRDDAASLIQAAETAYARGDRNSARRHVEEAITILRAMNNGYINSAVRKLEDVIAASQPLPQAGPFSDAQGN